MKKLERYYRGNKSEAAIDVVGSILLTVAANAGLWAARKLTETFVQFRRAKKISTLPEKDSQKIVNLIEKYFEDFGNLTLKMEKDVMCILDDAKAKNPDIDTEGILEAYSATAREGLMRCLRG